MFWAVRQSRLLILAPLSNPGIKSRIREKIPGTTSPDNHCKIQTRFQTCMARGLSDGSMCGVARCFYLFQNCLTTSRHHTNQAKTQGSRNRPKILRLLYIETNFQFSHQKTIHRLRHNDKNKLVQGDPLNFSPLNEEMNGEECTG